MIKVTIDDSLKRRYYQKGYWTQATLLDIWNEQVKLHPESPYAVDERHGSLSYAHIDELAGALAAHLVEKGVEEGDVVTFQLPVWAEFAITVVACLKIGVVMHPVSTSFNTRDLDFIMKQVKSAAFICPTRTRKGDYEQQALTIQATIPSLKTTVLVERGEKPVTRFPSYEQILAKRQGPNPVFAPKATTSDDVALILSTSGTTGLPKAVLLTHNNLIFSERALTGELGLTQDDVMFMPAPLNHATGFNHGLIAPMITGGSVVLQEKFDARKALELIKRKGVTWSMGSTPFIFDMLNHLEQTGERLENLRFYLCGGAPVPGSMVKRASTYGITLCEVYGSTESCPHVYVPPKHALSWNGAFSGQPFRGIEVKVVDANRCEVAPGEIGEEASRGPHLFVGYLNDPEASSQAMDSEGWFYSGDLCLADDQGRIRIQGRMKEIIVRGGKNISAVEVDNLVAGYPGIGDHATIGYPDERLGERICLVVTCDKPPTVDEMASYLCSKNVHKRLWPERIERVDAIPRTESGKVRRSELSRMVAEKPGGAGKVEAGSNSGTCGKESAHGL